MHFVHHLFIPNFRYLHYIMPCSSSGHDCCAEITNKQTNHALALSQDSDFKCFLFAEKKLTKYTPSIITDLEYFGESVVTYSLHQKI